MLSVVDLTKTYPGNDTPTIRGVSFEVRQGEAMVLVGPSGCGKTTTLRTVMGFERADAGRIEHGGRVLLAGEGRRRTQLPPERRGLGFVFQDYALFPHLSALQNVMYGIRGERRRRRAQRARECLWALGLMGVDDRRVQELSGGQQQRVALARAMAPGHRTILLDEPFSSLDPELRHAARSEVRMLAERTGLAIVLVTHDQEEALSTADRLAVMREGRLEQVGPPEEVYHRPRTAFVAQFLGRTNLLRGDAAGRCARTVLGEVTLEREAIGPVLLSLRPEHVSLRGVDTLFDTAAQGASGEVTARAFKGHDLTYTVRLLSESGRPQPTLLTVQTGHRARFEVGQRVRVEVNTPAVAVESSDAESV